MVEHTFPSTLSQSLFLSFFHPPPPPSLKLCYFVSIKRCQFCVCVFPLLRFVYNVCVLLALFISSSIRSFGANRFSISTALDQIYVYSHKLWYRFLQWILWDYLFIYFSLFSSRLFVCYHSINRCLFFMFSVCVFGEFIHSFNLSVVLDASLSLSPSSHSVSLYFPINPLPPFRSFAPCPPPHAHPNLHLPTTLICVHLVPWEIGKLAKSSPSNFGSNCYQENFVWIRKYHQRKHKTTTATAFFDMGKQSLVSDVYHK